MSAQTKEEYEVKYLGIDPAELEEKNPEAGRRESF